MKMQWADFDTWSNVGCEKCYKSLLSTRCAMIHQSKELSNTMEPYERNNSQMLKWLMSSTWELFPFNTIEGVAVDRSICVCVLRSAFGSMVSTFLSSSLQDSLSSGQLLHVACTSLPVPLILQKELIPSILLQYIILESNQPVSNVPYLIQIYRPAITILTCNKLLQT